MKEFMAGTPRRRRSLRAGLETAPKILTAPIFSDLPWLVHGFSTRAGGVSRFARGTGKARTGDLNLGAVNWDEPANVAENRSRFLKALGTGKMRLVTLRQIHSDLIHVIDQKTKLTTGMRGDGLVTDRSGLLLSILAADCLPVLLVDTERRVVAALHCGWRGTAKRIAEKAVGLLRQRFGSRPEDIRAAIGPGIRACCYRVGKDVAAEFEAQFIYAREILRFHKEVSLLEKKYPLVFRFQPRGHPPVDDRIVRLDLVAANARQLRDAGVSAANIWSDAPCTHCNAEMFFSHRRDAGVTGRMMAVVGIRREIRPPAAKGRRARIRRDSQA